MRSSVIDAHAILLLPATLLLGNLAPPCSECASVPRYTQSWWEWRNNYYIMGGRFVLASCGRSSSVAWASRVSLPFDENWCNWWRENLNVCYAHDTYLFGRTWVHMRRHSFEKTHMPMFFAKLMEIQFARCICILLLCIRIRIYC